MARWLRPKPAKPAPFCAGGAGRILHWIEVNGEHDAGNCPVCTKREALAAAEFSN